MSRTLAGTGVRRMLSCPKAGLTPKRRLPVASKKSAGSIAETSWNRTADTSLFRAVFNHPQSIVITPVIVSFPPILGSPIGPISDPRLNQCGCWSSPHAQMTSPPETQPHKHDRRKKIALCERLPLGLLKGYSLAKL